MVKLSGLFDSFDNLDQIDINSLTLWLKPSPQPIQLENYLANKILYPQAISITEADMKIDLAILREALRINGPKNTNTSSALLGDNPFLNLTLRKILIPEQFLQFVPNLVSLTWAFVDGLLLTRRKEDKFQDLWTIVLVDDIDEIVGSVILPQFSSRNGEMDLSILGKVYKIRTGALMVVPCGKDRCEIAYKIKDGQVLGKAENALELYGGKLGIMVDGRLP